MEHRAELERFCADAHPQLVAALAHYTGDRWLAEELAQDALIRACDHWARVRTMQSPVGWAFRVGVNLASSHFRRRSAERRAHARHGPDEQRHDDPPTADRVAVTAALAELSPRQREAVVLRYFVGLTVAQAGEVLDAPEGTVRSLTHRAIAALHDILDLPADTEGAADAS